MDTHIKILSSDSPPPPPHHICWFGLPEPHCSMFSSWFDCREETHWLGSIFANPPHQSDHTQILKFDGSSSEWSSSDPHQILIRVIILRSSSLTAGRPRRFLTWREIPLEDISPHSALMTFSWRTGDPPFIVTKGKDLTTKKGGPYKWQTNICKLVFLSFPYHLDDDPQPAESTRASQRSAPLPPFLFTFSIGTLRSRLSLEKVEKRNSTLLKLNLTTRWREWGSSDIAECGEQQRDLPGQLHQQHHQPLLPHHYLHLPHSNLSSPDVTKTLVRGTYPHLQWWQWNLISTHKTRRTLWTPDLCLWWKGTNKCICCPVCESPRDIMILIFLYISYQT